MGKKEATRSSQKNQPFVLNGGPWGMSAFLVYLERFLFYNEQQRRRGEGGKATAALGRTWEKRREEEW